MLGKVPERERLDVPDGGGMIGVDEPASEVAAVTRSPMQLI